MPKCIICGKYFEEDNESINLDLDADIPNKNEDPLFGDESDNQKTRSVNVCKMCRNRLNRDAKDAQKTPKPM